MFNLFRKKKTDAETPVIPEEAKWFTVDDMDGVEVRVEPLLLLKVRMGPAGSRVYGRYELTETDLSEGRDAVIQDRVSQFVESRTKGNDD
ncbi:hypothetical protein [Streptomyces sp. NPDC005385]|uniref:hypothetical protein n=1 Tax=Streptomyces sp. NPDC005385 TaxID=3157039 RepID=UPI0033A6C88B